MQGTLFDKLSDELVVRDRVILYVLVFGLMATAGIPIFLTSNTPVVALFCISAACAFFLRVRLMPYIGLISIFVLVLFLQMVYFGFSFYKGTVGLQMIVFLTGMLGAAITGIYFVKVYNNLMVLFSLISLALFIPIYIHYPFHDLLINSLPFSTSITDEFTDTTSQSIFFLNFPRDFEERVRNTGPFWEPGAFGGFLTVSFMLNSIKENSIVNKKNVLFAITIISTFSTTAYLTLFIFIAGFYLLTIKSNVTRITLMGVFVAGFLIVYNGLDFLSPKIKSEFENVADDVDTYGGNGRVASGYLDMREFGEENFYFLAGRGVHPDTRYGGNFKNVIRTNGLTDQLVVWGIPFFLIYFFNVRKSFAAFCDLYGVQKALSWICLGVLLTLSTSEVYFRTDFFWVLFFIHIPVNEYLKLSTLADADTN